MAEPIVASQETVDLINTPTINTRQAALDSYFADDIAKKAVKDAEDKALEEARIAEFGQTLTLEDVSGSFNLQRLGATSGDRVKDGKLIDRKSVV
jgi:hypothetical protein